MTTPTATLTRPPAPPEPSHRAVDQPHWVRPSAAAMLLVTAVLYLWNLAASGWANSYYAAAVQAGTKSWEAMFFGSLDSGNLITVDKPPASLWVMELSTRIFGFNAWSLLAPQALEGVAAVGLLYLTVKRWHGPVAGLLAGVALAATPVAALMFRFDNPDSLLTLLLVAAAYALTRAIERAGTRWLLLAGVAIGFAFLTKMLQGFLVLPGLALVYLLAAPTSAWHRIRQLLAAGVAAVVGAGWWVAIVELWPASARPYVGGSANNSVLELVLGYNGLSRITGGSGASGGAGGNSSAAAGSSFGGATGLDRLFSSDMAVDVAWLLPAALLSIVLVLWTTRRAPRTDRTRAATLLWGSWLVVTGLVFSYMQGIVHPYYTVALAPAVAALVAIGGGEMWKRSDRLIGRAGLAALVSAAGGMGFVLLARNADWLPWLRYAVLALTVVSAAGLLLTGARFRRAAAVLLLVGTLAGLAGPTAYTVATAATTHSGSIPTAGPAGAASSGMGGGQGGGTMPSGTRPSGTAPTGTAPTGTAPSGTMPSGTRPSGSGGGTPGGSTTSSTALTALLKATTGTWSAATVGAQSAASLELSSGTAVMGIGGWSGTDNAPTLAQFKQYVAQGKVHYFIASTGGGGGQGGDSAITSWVTSTYTATTVGGSTVYDLSASS
jgi:4-amino-4-deoxy-L-arabinose transferase-like glycosyltransferase